MPSFKTAAVTSALLGAVAAHPHHHSKRGLPLGTIYSACTTPGVVALTFDDGPFIYTQEIVDQLTAAGHKGTFFQNGTSLANKLAPTKHLNPVRTQLG